jgi:hypothetical protein
MLLADSVQLSGESPRSSDPKPIVTVVSAHQNQLPTAFQELMDYTERLADSRQSKNLALALDGIRDTLGPGLTQGSDDFSDDCDLSLPIRYEAKAAFAFIYSCQGKWRETESSLRYLTDCRVLSPVGTRFASNAMFKLANGQPKDRDGNCDEAYKWLRGALAWYEAEGGQHQIRRLVCIKRLADIEDRVSRRTEKLHYKRKLEKLLSEDYQGVDIEGIFPDSLG